MVLVRRAWLLGKGESWREIKRAQWRCGPTLALRWRLRRNTDACAARQSQASGNARRSWKWREGTPDTHTSICCVASWARATNRLQQIRLRPAARRFLLSVPAAIVHGTRKNNRGNRRHSLLEGEAH